VDPVTEPWQFLCDLRSWPFVRIEQRGPRAFLYGAMDGDLFGTLDLSTGALALDLDADLHIDVTDDDSRRAAEALIRRCVDRERFSPQLRAASP
jgi:hypothetical protein